MAGESRSGRSGSHYVATGLTDYHAKLLALVLTRRSASDSVERLVGAFSNAQVELNPHQVEAALFTFPMTTTVETEMITGKTVHAIAGGLMLVCFDRALTLEQIRFMADLRPERVVRLDAGFKNNDQINANANAVLAFKSKGVVKFMTV